MVLEEVHFRVAYLVAAVGVLFLLRRPFRYPNRPGSKWFAVTIVATSLWLGCVGLYYFVHSLTGSLILYTTVQFVITICFISWFLVAVEFATGRRPARSLVLFLAALAIVHFIVLWTNFFWVHDLAYRSNAWVDDTGGIRIAGGPLYWVHIVSMYVLVFISTTLYVSQWASSSGLRRRQAAILAMTPAVGVGANLLLLLDVGLLGFDPTPIGVIVGVVLMGWALYRAEFLDVTPIARQTVVERMADAVIIIDDRNRVVDWNRAALELFDVDDPVAGMATEAFFHAVSSNTLEVLVETERAEVEIAFERDGRRRHALVSIDPVEGDAFEPLGRVIVARDVTGIKRREQQLVKQNEYLDEFAGIVSHDMQGPLMQIRLNTDLARRTNDVSSLDSVLDATDRMRRLVDDLLDLARTGHQLDDLEPVEFADLANTAWGCVWTPEAELVVETDQTVLADPDRLQQLLENIFRNSVEHASVDDRPQRGDRPLAVDHSSAADGQTMTGADKSKEDGDATANGVRVRIGSLVDGFFIEDDGTGIPLELRERVFERGYSTSEDGTGLGLSIVSHIAGAHGWSVCATESAQGGARFEITGVDTVE
ncbi:histidine kinase N-terminal 7TM domain-containing protein [Natrialbaceae archaeon A-chndr2]